MILIASIFFNVVLLILTYTQQHNLIAQQRILGYKTQYISELHHQKGLNDEDNGPNYFSSAGHPISRDG